MSVTLRPGEGARASLSPSMLTGGSSFSVCRYLSSLRILFLNAALVSISLAPISGHCAPCPVKIQPTGGGAPSTTALTVAEASWTPDASSAMA